MASDLGLARDPQILIAVSRASPTYGDKPGHDGTAIQPDVIMLWILLCAHATPGAVPGSQGITHPFKMPKRHAVSEYASEMAVPS